MTEPAVYAIHRVMQQLRGEGRDPKDIRMTPDLLRDIAASVQLDHETLHQGATLWGLPIVETDTEPTVPGWSVTY